MHPLHLDYQRAAAERHWPGLLLLGATLILTGLLLAQYQAIISDLAARERQVSRLRREADHQRMLEAKGGPASGINNGLPPSQSTERWEALFNALEAAGDDTVTLLDLEPGAKEISISGEARGLTAAMDYVTRLQSAQALANVHLTEYEIVKDHPGNPARFTLLAEWPEKQR